MANQNFKVKKGLEVGTGTTVSVDGINVTGVITATTFVGDGSALTGVTASGTGVVVQEEGSNIGTAATINFIGSNVTAALSGGIANVTVSGGSGGLSNVVEDTTPQLGGNLDLNSKDITGTGNISITGGFNATGVSTFQENVVFESTASFGDSDKINVGAGNDLQIFHDGTSNIISDAVGAGISLVGNTKVVGVLTATSFTASENLNVAGVSTFSAIRMGDGDDGNTNNLKFGADNDLNIYHNGSHAFLQNQTGNVYLRSSSGTSINIEPAAGAAGIIANAGGDVELYYNNSKKFETTTGGVDITGTLDVNDDITIVGSSPTVKLQDSDSAQNYAYLEFDAQSGNTLFLRSRAFFNTPNFRYQSEAGGSINTDDIFTVLGTSGGFRVGINSSDPEQRLTVGGNIKASDLLLASGTNITGVATATSFSGSGSALTGLTGASAGTYGASTNTPIITVDSNGRITGIATVATSGAGGGGGISNIVEDTTPQLGGNLDLNSKSITGTGNIEITGYAGVSGVSTFSGAVGFATHIHDAGTGGLDIRTNLLRIKNDADSETLATFTENGAVSLYHDNALRLATTNTGVSITDNLNVAGVSTFTGNVILNANLDLQDNDKINLGDNDDLQISHDGTTSIISGMYHPIELRHQSEVHIKCVDDGAVELYHDNSKKLETTSSGVTVTGTLAATAVTGDGSGLTGLPAPGISTASSNVQVNFDVTANGSSAYRFTGPGNDAADNNPDLYLIRGQRYRFTNNSGGSHPFQIRSAAGGSAYSTGVTNNGGASGNIDFNVQHDAPSRLYYQCTSHSAMVGNIYITGGANWQTTSVNTSTAEEIFTLNSVGIGTDNPNNNLDIAVDSNNEGIRISSSTNVFGKIDFHANRSGADNALGILDFNWNGTQVARIIGGTGTDTTNKDDGALQFHTASAGTATERLRITSDGIVRVPDNGKFTAGAGDDLQIYHDGSNSYIKDSGTGRLLINTSGFRLNNAANNENIIHAEADGAVELYHNNVKKLETTTGGVTVTGSLIATANLEAQNNIQILDNKKLLIGNSSDLQIYHDTNNSFIKDTGTGRLTIATSQLQLTNAADSAVMIRATESDTVELFHNGTKRLETTNLGVKVSSNLYLGGSTNGGFSYNSTANTLEFLMTDGGTHSELTSNAYVPSASATRHLGYHNKRWDKLFCDGVRFGGDNTDATTLDDYEEGTFTATITPGSGSYSYSYGQTGYYRKIGTLVFINVWIHLSTSNASGTITLSGLPFNCQSASRNWIPVGGYGHGGSPGNSAGMWLIVAQGATTGSFIYLGDTHGTATTTNASHLPQASELYINGSYISQ